MIEHGECAPGGGKMKERLALAACGPVDHASATLIGRVWMREFDGDAVVAVRRRRPMGRLQPRQTMESKRGKRCRLNRI